MKKLLYILAIFSVATLSAQNYTSPTTVCYGTEPSRTAVIPYDKAADAVAGNEASSIYVRRVTADWTRTEEGGVVQFASRFSMPVIWLNRQVIVRVEPMATAYEVQVNGKVAGYVQSGAVATEFNVTKLVDKDRNEIIITALGNLPIHSMRQARAVTTPDVRIICQPSLRVRDILLNTELNEQGEGLAEIGVVMKCNTLNTRRSRLQLTLTASDGAVLLSEYRDISLGMRREQMLTFSVRVPADKLWSLENPNMLRLDIDNRVDGRVGEFISRNIGLRKVEVRDGALHINGNAAGLRAAEYDPAKSLDELAVSGTNCLLVTNGDAPATLYDECDRRGVAIIPRAALDTSCLGSSIARGGNPTNDPAWGNAFILRNEDNFLSTHPHASVVGFMLGKGTTAGVNIYDSYLHVKSLSKDRPVLYDGAGGEWCTDLLHIK